MCSMIVSGSPEAYEATCADGDEQLRLELARSYLQPPHTQRLCTATFSAGEVLAGRFVIERMLSRGGMGEVYVAFDRMLEQPIAVKVMLATLADDDRAVRRLCREVRTARRIRHPNVCGVYDVGVHDVDRRDTCYFMTMDYIAGQSMRCWAIRRRLSIETVKRLSLQILGGLDAVHSVGIIHADLKADNIMITGEAGSERAILVDFGLARRVPRQHQFAREGLVGTMGYLAPELSSGRGATIRSDIFSVGIVMFEMLTGCLPFDRGPVRTERPPSLRALRPDISAEHEAIIQRCLRAGPDERYANIAGLIAALEAVP